MRVLHAADFGGTAGGGFVPLIAALARRLTARGDAFALAVPQVAGASWHQTARDAGAELHVVSGAREAARFAAAWRPDVLHLHFFGWEVPLTLGLWRSHARIYWHAHSTSLRGGIRLSPRSLLKYRGAGARVTRHIAVSRAVAGELAARGAARARIIVVPNAVDSARFRPPSGDERRAARAALGLGTEPAILFYGRDPHLKGADLLAGALGLLPGTTVVAVATPEDARSTLAQHARVVSIERTDDVRPLLAAVDALAMPSRGEGSPLAFIEAALSGVPIAASDLPALREAGAGRERIWYAALGDDPALAAALRDALASSRFTPAAPPYDPGDWAARIAEVYDGARSSGGVRARHGG